MYFVQYITLGLSRQLTGHHYKSTTVSVTVNFIVSLNHITSFINPDII